MDIQWYPGHMAKAMRLIKEQLKTVDIVLAMGDARAVRKSINADFTAALGNKPYLYVFNKTDLADPAVTRAWEAYFAARGENVFFIEALNKKSFAPLTDHLKKLKETFRFAREVRVMAAGIPNVGKSMFINAVAGRSAAETQDRPGVTRANKWIKCRDFFLLSLEILAFMSAYYPERLIGRYRLESAADTPLALLEAIAAKRGFVVKGGEADYERCAATVLKEFKNGTLGPISIDRPEEADG
jgi:ribosome biogenesis GTPase A